MTYSRPTTPCLALHVTCILNRIHSSPQLIVSLLFIWGSIYLRSMTSTGPRQEASSSQQTSPYHLSQLQHFFLFLALENVCVRVIISDTKGLFIMLFLQKCANSRSAISEVYVPSCIPAVVVISSRPVAILHVMAKQ